MTVDVSILKEVKVLKSAFKKLSANVLCQFQVFWVNWLKVLVC